MTAVEAGDRAAWLRVVAPGAVVEDPIGPSACSTPTAKATAGPEASRRTFYDNVIAMGRIGLHDPGVMRAATSERRNDPATTLPAACAIVDGVYTYRVNDDGRVVALRTLLGASAPTPRAARG